MNKTIAGLVMLLASLTGGTALAQVGSDLNNFNAAVEEARTIIQTERKMLIVQNMTLTDAEAQKFWPLYDKYAAEMKAAGDLRIKVIKDFALAYNSNSVTDADAKEMLDNMLKFQRKSLSVREDYRSKFRKVLGDRNTARFYQIENKLDAITNLMLAREIPLVPAPQ
jgi:Spy/CpxP family protein refolding chaperone